jgi:hypothetical protein
MGKISAVEIQHQGGAAIFEETKEMSLAEELQYWAEADREAREWAAAARAEYAGETPEETDARFAALLALPVRPKKVFDCVEMMHQGGERLRRETEGMTPEEESAYWAERDREFVETPDGDARAPLAERRAAIRARRKSA